jgi:hypothetical protein
VTTNRASSFRLGGGPPSIDMWDCGPVRRRVQAIATTGDLQICELMLTGQA